jgi:YVTN family beta-propeller protein
VRRVLSFLLPAIACCTTAAAFAATEPPLPQPQGLLIVLNKEESTVSFFEARTAPAVSERLRLIKTLPTGKEPHEVAVSPDGREAWISNAGADTLGVFDLRRLEAIVTIRHDRFAFPHGSAFTPDGRKLYVASTRRNSVFVLDVAKRRVAAEIPTGQTDTHMVAMAPDGARIFVPNIGSRAISVIATGNDKLAGEIRVGRGPEGIALTPDGKRLLVANQEDSTVSVIDTATLGVVDAFEVGEVPVRLIVTPDGKRAFSADRKGNTITVIQLDAEHPRVVKRVPVGKSPGGMALDGAGRTLFVALNDEARVALIDVTTLEKLGEVATGKGPDGIAFVSGWAPASGP